MSIAAAGAPLSALRAIAATPIRMTQDEITQMQREDTPFARTDAEIAQEMARYKEQQDKVEAHTVFRTGGKIVAVLYRDGSATYGLNADGARHPMGEGNLGLDAVSSRMAQSLQKKYGAGLSVDSYDEGSAPTQGELSRAMFGTSGLPSGGIMADRARVSFDTSLLETLGRT